MKVGCFKAAMEAGSAHTSVPSIDCSSPSLTHTHTPQFTCFSAVPCCFYEYITQKKSACAINEVLSLFPDTKGAPDEGYSSY